MATPKLIQQFINIVGEEGVIFAPEDVIVFEYDGSIDRGLPKAVVFPRSADEVSRVVRLARAAGLPIVPRGSGTGLSGGAVPMEPGVIIAMTRMKRVLEIDPVNRLAVVEPGVINLDISKAVAPYGLYYAPDPSSQRACSIGGNIAENSGGPHCLALGSTTNHVLALETVLPDGSVVWLGDRTGEAPGYDLRGVFIGSEGTLGIVTRIVVRLLPLPESVRTLLAAYPTMEAAGGTVSDVIAAGIIPAAMEMLDRVTIKAVEEGLHAGYPEDAEAVLLIEVEGLTETVTEQLETIEAICRARGAQQLRIAADDHERERLWAGRKGAFGTFGRLAPNWYVLDGVVPRTTLPRIIEEVGRIGREYGYIIANVFHAGDGNLHPCVMYDARIPGETERVLEAGREIMRLCVDAGGALSGEHGIGIEKQDFMGWVFNEDDLNAMRKLRPAFGADEHFNPGKIFPGARGDCSRFTQAIAERALAIGAYI